MKTFLKGFSLIEVSISLLVFGIVSSMCITQLASFTALDRMQKTQRHCDFVINAIGAYYLASDGNVPAPVGNLADGFGSVPYKKLGIMEKYSKDGFGNSLMYKVNPFFNTNISDQNYITLGIPEFSSSEEDKIAIILKAVDRYGKEMYKIWYSERNFKAMFKLQNALTGTQASNATSEKSNVRKRSAVSIPVIED